jgi:hypothetical protein
MASQWQEQKMNKMAGVCVEDTHGETRSQKDSEASLVLFITTHSYKNSLSLQNLALSLLRAMSPLT